MFSAARFSLTNPGPLVQKMVATPCGSDTITRWKHSSTQIKRLFKRNPARYRVAKREGWLPEPEPLPPPKYSAVWEPVILPNGWSAPPDPSVAVPKYPFVVSRTKDKPNGAIGFLPVYAEFRKDGASTTTRIRKVSGDVDAFLAELRSTLNIPVPKNPKDDTVRIRTGGTIELKGNRVREVKHWLAALGF